MATDSARSFAYLRIAFGLVWAVDAALKWQPLFFSQFVTYFMTQGQPTLVASWIGAWSAIILPHAHIYALAIAVMETALAICLLLGFMTRPAIIAGGALSFLIWTIPEGLGGPYTSGATDVGAAIIYILVFVALWIGKSWQTYSLDAYLMKKHWWQKDFTAYLVPESITADLDGRTKDQLLRILIIAVIVLGVMVSMQYMPLLMTMSPQSPMSAASMVHM